MKTLAKWSVGDYHRMIEAGILRDRLVELLAGEVCEIQKPQFITILSDETVNTSKNCSQVKLMSASTSQLHYRIPNQNQIRAIARSPESAYQEYWVLNLSAKQMIVFRYPQDGDYAIEKKLEDGIMIPLAFPDIRVSVERLLG